MGGRPRCGVVPLHRALRIACPSENRHVETADADDQIVVVRVAGNAKYVAVLDSQNHAGGVTAESHHLGSSAKIGRCK